MEFASINNMVLSYQQNPSDELRDHIYEGIKRIIFKTCNVYIKFYNTASTKQDLDVYNEAYIIFNKCLNKYHKGDFTTYLYGQLRENLSLEARKKYYNVMPIPTRIYKEMRKRYLKDGTPYENLTIVNSEWISIEPKINTDNECINDTFNLVESNFDKEYALMFMHWSGLYSQMTSKDLADIFHLTIGEIDKKMLEIRKFLALELYGIDLQEYAKDKYNNRVGKK